MSFNNSLEDSSLFKKLLEHRSIFFETLINDKEFKGLAYKVFAFGDEAWLDSDEAALFLSISKGSLNNMVSSGQIQRDKIGGRNRFQLSKLKRLLQQ